jgi:hypothetical protein
VVGVENFFRVVDGAGFLGSLFPGNGEQPVNVIAADGGLGRHGRHGFELFELLDGLVEDFLGHAGGFDFLAQLVELAFFAAAQLLLDGLDLFVEVVLFLRALHLALDAGLNVAVEVELFNFDVEHVGDTGEARGRVEDGEQFLLFLDAELEIGGDGIGKLGGLVHLHCGNDGLVVERLLQLDVVLKKRGDALHELLDCRAHLEFALAGAHGGDEEAVAVGDFNGLGALHALDQDLDVAVGHFDALHDVADGADLVNVLGLGLVDGGVVLGGEENLAVAGQGLFEGAHAGLAAHDERRHHIGEDDHVADGHHGQLARLVFFARHGHRGTWVHLTSAGASTTGADCEVM